MIENSPVQPDAEPDCCIPAYDKPQSRAPGFDDIEGREQLSFSFSHPVNHVSDLAVMNGVCFLNILRLICCVQS